PPYAMAEATGTREELDPEPEETSVCGTQVVVLDAQTLEEIDGEVLASGGDEDRMLPLAPDLDGMTEEVHVSRMGEVDQDPHVPGSHMMLWDQEDVGETVRDALDKSPPVRCSDSSAGFARAIDS